MPKAPTVQLTKMIEATKIHPRTNLPLGLPPATIPYGALIEPVGADRDRERFKYLGELFECKQDLFLSATGGAKGPAEPAPAEPAPAAAEEVALPEAPSGPRLEWQRLHSSNYTVLRASVPGGWLVSLNGYGVAFVPDADHGWDGGSAG